MVVATQMMESMVKNSRPTRAEVTDAGQSVVDLNDCVMLSGESAGGDFPVESVTQLTNILSYTEQHIFYSKIIRQGNYQKYDTIVKNLINILSNKKVDFVLNMSQDVELSKVLS